MLPQSPLRFSTMENPILRTFEILKMLRCFHLAHLEMIRSSIESIFRKSISFLMIFIKPKRCATSVRSFWRRFRALSSVMCQKTNVSVFEKKNIFLSHHLSDWYNKKYIRAVDMFYLIHVLI